MITYDFSKVTGPLYEYIYQQIKQDILEGNLQAGEKLPSKRTFAKNNGISTITIQNAYDQLISEGYIFTLPKRGYYVANMGDMAKVPKADHVRLDIHLPEKPSYDVDLSSNRVNADNFPFSVWARLIRETLSSKKKELMEPSPTGGLLELREAIAEHLNSFRGMLVDPDQIVIGAGTEYLYGLLIQLLGTDKRYCIENPGYGKLSRIYAQNQISCQYVNMDEKGITVDGLLQEEAQVAHISPNHHFPTGITMPADRRYEILAWANGAEGRYLIEDDYDSEFRPNGKPIPTLFSMDGCEKVIYMNTFSKSLTSTIRISYMVLPTHLANRFYQELSFYSCTVSNFEQYTLAAFIKQGYFEKHINRMRLYYSRQRKKILQKLEASAFKDTYTIRENGSGLHFLLEIATEKSDEEITEKLKSIGVRIRPLSDYYMNESVKSEHVFLINYSDLDVEKLLPILERAKENENEKNI